jgi:hypothetical protein
MPSLLHDHELDQSPHRGDDIHGHPSGGGHLPDDRVDTLVINALEESPFHSVRSLASTIKMPPTTVWQYLHAKGCVVRNPHIVLHMLSLVQKSGPSRIGNRIEENALLGETLWLVLHSNGDMW